MIQTTNKFKETEAKDTEHFEAKREQLMQLDCEIRKLHETICLLENESSHYQRVAAADQTLKGHRAELVHNNLKQALADASHHLKWL